MRLRWLLTLSVVLAGSVSARAVPALLSTGGKARASSELVPYTPPGSAANGIDGNRDGDYYAGASVFHSASPEPNPPVSFEVDLGTTYDLDRVAIWPRTDVLQGTVRNFRLSVFDDVGAPVWERSFLPENQADNVWATTALRGVRGRRVRITRDLVFRMQCPAFDTVG